ncbi:MAG: calcium-binding protein [Solirubrobacterales bacterium]
MFTRTAPVGRSRRQSHPLLPHWYVAPQPLRFDSSRDGLPRLVSRHYCRAVASGDRRRRFRGEARTQLPRRPSDDCRNPRCRRHHRRRDVIVGQGGNDAISGVRGNDVICGGRGSDALSGQRGADRLYGGPGLDVVHGQQGADRLYGAGGDDALLGIRGVTGSSASREATGSPATTGVIFASAGRRATISPHMTQATSREGVARRSGPPFSPDTRPERTGARSFRRRASGRG